jgi:hypothetical protein
LRNERSRFPNFRQRVVDTCLALAIAYEFTICYSQSSGKGISMKRKLVRGWRTYRSVAGKVVSEIDVANDDMPGVIIFFRDGTQLHIEVRHPVEFQARLQKMIDGDLKVLHTFPAFKEVKR